MVSTPATAAAVRNAAVTYAPDLRNFVFALHFVFGGPLDPPIHVRELQPG